MESLNLSLAAHKPLSGSMTLPGDKSLALRAALFSALAEGTSEIDNFPDSGVTRTMLAALQAIGPNGIAAEVEMILEAED